MTRRKVIPATPAIDRSHIVCEAGRAGEMVGVRGERGAFTIIQVCMNVNSGAEWVELRDNERAFRAVRPDRLIQRRTRRRRAD